MLGSPLSSIYHWAEKIVRKKIQDSKRLTSSSSESDNRIIGATGFNEKSNPIAGVYEIGYWLHKKYHGKGLVSEFVNALTRFALVALNAEHVQICVQVENNKSISVAKRCGYELIKTLKNDRIDCSTAEPADSLLFICESEESLPSLSFRWY